uniref:Uncharacterized protein n=1 Tax=Manihot esculenta TaxID=3983 RepID=A0A2C9VCW8_MANES
MMFLFIRNMMSFLNISHFFTSSCCNFLAQNLQKSKYSSITKLYRSQKYKP